MAANCPCRMSKLQELVFGQTWGGRMLDLMNIGLTHAGERRAKRTLRRSSIPGAPRPQAISNSRRMSASLATELIVVIFGSLVFDGEKCFALESKGAP